MYLGILFTQHLDYNITAKGVAQIVGRALGLLIAKLKIVKIYHMLYNFCVVPVLTYAASVLGCKSLSYIMLYIKEQCSYFLALASLRLMHIFIVIWGGVQ